MFCAMEDIISCVDLKFKSAKSFHKITVEFPPFETKQSLYVSTAACTDYDLTGEVLWPMSRLMSYYLLSHPEIVKDKHVCELGAGAGLPSFVALQMGAASVHMTDGQLDVLDLCTKSIECLSDNLRSKCSCLLLRWGDELPVALLPAELNVIIASDVIYGVTAIPLFCQTLQDLFQKYPEVECYVAYLSRALTVDEALHAAFDKGQFHVNKIDFPNSNAASEIGCQEINNYNGYVMRLTSREQLRK
eukprot:Gregarina_sp_Poly_1__9928@NODE_652_length_6929_cov_76_457010_g495_i0_p2_GENE_NODE_652_length_6929_cov_76_457010_g495_i0NODE_652_length_6929_cov_76_457010_g495_i0_p2_ORF_typecomplete_len246_score23_69Methyltransf_16/PF10294_9/8_7e34PrmA/PF06325_13/0_00032Cons_hypoth95/PF03602_15/0_00042MTS/PF05175_14/0_0013Methyltransf_9/PF08003_11/0_018Methyltransf_31/PF13847_6/0_043Methyltransf_23/PF13489_6/0_083_NODE_652_length_6929_cov_76_457010_g495_i035194256